MQICEDVPQVLDSDICGLSERPINVFLPRFLQVTFVVNLLVFVPFALCMTNSCRC